MVWFLMCKQQHCRCLDYMSSLAYTVELITYLAFNTFTTILV